MFKTVTLTSFSSGAFQYALGWRTINVAASPFLVLVVIANLWLRSKRQMQAADLRQEPKKQSNRSLDSRKE